MTRSIRVLFLTASLGLGLASEDVVYTTPSPQVWEAMPAGGGDLSAMVRWDGSLRLHLSKSDAWGFQAPPDAPPGTRFFNNVSPGHVRISFGAGAAPRHFRQILDLEQGCVRLEVDDARIQVWGHPWRKLLAVEIHDPGARLGRPEVELIEWRPTMRVRRDGDWRLASEIHERAARPHLANTGMENFFSPDRDPLRGRGLGVAVTTEAPTILIACAVTTSGDPAEAARRELRSAMAQPVDALRAEQRAWWRQYWSRSHIRLTSSDGSAERLARAYQIHLYTLGCVNRGPVPAKWDGGPGLLEQDRRNWGLAEWMQEIRFTYWPLYAADQLEQAQGLFRHYSSMLPYLEAQTGAMWGLPGIWVPETVLPWGHAEDFVLAAKGGPLPPHYQRRDPARIPYGRFDAFNPYVGFLFTSGLELCHHYLTYYRYSGDEGFLRTQAYPMVKGVTEFVAALLRKEPDGRYHLDPANALETWWLVRDPADTMAGIRAVFPEFVRLAERYGRDADLRRRCAAILRALPPPFVPQPPKDTPRNRENPELYRIAPFGLSGMGAPDYDAALDEFTGRRFRLTDGWSLDALWAARLGLKREAPRLLEEHARKFNRFRYGGWTSNDSRVYPGGLSVTPFLDAGGASAIALQETLLQSHGGLLRILPAASPDWSGAFRLRAEGGFLVSVEFAQGRARKVEISSLLGRECVLENPWPGRLCGVRGEGRTVLRSRARRLRFQTVPEGTYSICQHSD